MKSGPASAVLALILLLGQPLAATAGPTPGGADSDADGVENGFDDCSNVSNASQTNIDRDGCCGFVDFGSHEMNFSKSPGPPALPAALRSLSSR